MDYFIFVHAKLYGSGIEHKFYMQLKYVYTAQRVITLDCAFSLNYEFLPHFHPHAQDISTNTHPQMLPYIFDGSSLQNGL